MKVNPFNLKRPSVAQETRTFTDPLQPGIEFDVTFKSLDAIEDMQVMDIGQQYYNYYVGNGEDRPQAQFPSIDGKPVKISRSMCFVAAGLMVAQVVSDEKERYTFEQWVGIAATMPTAFTHLVNFSHEVSRSAPKAPTGSEVSTGSSLTPASTGSELTPNSSIEQTPFSPPSTNDLEPLSPHSPPE